MHLHLRAQRPQMPACRHDCVHVAEISHVLGAWEKRGMRSRCCGRGYHQHNNLSIRDSDRTFTQGLGLGLGTWEKIRLMAQMTGQHGLSDKRHTIPSPKPHDAHSRYLHTDTQVQRPITACQGPVQLPCDDAAIALCR
jgi:hypothetical protein